VLTERLAAPLSPEDHTAQSTPDAGPVTWHGAHTSWFFEDFLFEPAGGYQVHDPSHRHLSNSYYEAVGPRHPRPQRGLATQPSAAEVGRRRERVDAGVEALLGALPDDVPDDLLVLGLDHEELHQELFVMDAKQHLSARRWSSGRTRTTPTEGHPSTDDRSDRSARGMGTPSQIGTCVRRSD
jgi:hypothetical protein